MAEGVVTDVAGKLLKVLTSRVFQEFELAREFEEEIGKLKDTVETIKGVLVDAEEKHVEKNEGVTVWIRRLKDAFYDADDLLDDFATELKQREVVTGSRMTKEVCSFFSKPNQIAYSLKMAHKIKAVRAKLEEIKNDRQFHLTEHRDEKQVNIREHTHSFLREEMVIGRDNEKNEIINLLLEPNDQDENVVVIPIVGMGGLGKTTLAQLAYNDEEVKNHFVSRMWVCVSEEFNVEMLVQKIIISATNEEPRKLDVDQLIKDLHKEINEKKYLLVLDDIWNEDPVKWNKLKDLLINGARGSKILVTTRSQQVAKITNRHLSYDLKGLDKQKSWSLFSQRAFEHGIEPGDSNELVEIGKEIVAKCGGIPLVISTIGSLLNSNITENYWSSVRDNEMFEIMKREGGILPILKFSYDQLPSHLKQCFAYCALFPKGFKIEKQKLISLWMAQGFLESSNRDQCLKDVGNKYFMLLQMRSFFQDLISDDHGNVIACKMHDFMHDLAQSVAGVECTLTTSDTTQGIEERCRHVSVDCRNVGLRVEFPNILLRRKRIRTLLLLDTPFYVYKCYDHHKILSSCKYLRALNFSGCNLTRLSNAIGKLKHLRYLNLFGNDLIEKLPNCISKLKNLETVDLSHCRGLKELPRNMRKMVNLKDVIITGCCSDIRMPLGVWALSNVDTLRVIVLHDSRNNRKYGLQFLLPRIASRLAQPLFSSFFVFEVDPIFQGREVGIRNLEQMDNAKLENYLEKMQFLQLLGGPHSRSETDGRCEEMLERLKPHRNLKEIEIGYFMGVKLPSWHSSATNLTSITLLRCKRCQYIPEMDNFPSLNSLKLEKLDDLEYISDKAINCSSTSSTTFFPSLRNISLVKCPKLKGWWRRDDGATNQILFSFACLLKLKIQNCPNLTSMPPYPSIEELTLVDTSSKPLQRTMMMVNSAGPSTSSAPLSKLEKLYMESIDDLECLPEDGLRNLASLQKMVIIECKELDLLGTDDTEWQGLGSLRSLRLKGLPKLVSLPNGLQFVTSLEGLRIGDCPNLKAPPKWMCNLTSPSYLEIKRCPQFSRECRNNTGKDWPNIAHIPYIGIDGKHNQGWLSIDEDYDG